MQSPKAGPLGRPRRLLLLLSLLVLAGCSAAATPALPGAVQTRDSSGQWAGGTASEQGGKDTSGGGTPGAFKDTAKIVWTGSLQLQVKDLDAALTGAQASITGLGGYISASRRTGSDQPVASVTYRIPSDRWEDGLTALRKLAIKVIDEQTSSADVASQLVDNDARLKNLRASETALQEIAAKATKISDVLEVQARLTDVRGEIESLAAQQVALQDQVSFGTLTVTYGLQVVAVTQAAKQWDPATEVDAASARLVSFLQSLASAGIWFAIVWLPGLLILAVIAFVLVRIWRRMGIRVPDLINPRTGGGGMPGAGG